MAAAQPRDSAPGLDDKNRMVFGDRAHHFSNPAGTKDTWHDYWNDLRDAGVDLSVVGGMGHALQNAKLLYENLRGVAGGSPIVKISRKPATPWVLYETRMKVRVGSFAPPKGYVLAQTMPYLIRVSWVGLSGYSIADVSNHAVDLMVRRNQESISASRFRFRAGSEANFILRQLLFHAKTAGEIGELLVKNGYKDNLDRAVRYVGVFISRLTQPCCTGVWGARDVMIYQSQSGRLVIMGGPERWIAWQYLLSIYGKTALGWSSALQDYVGTYYGWVPQPDQTKQQILENADKKMDILEAEEKSDSATEGISAAHEGLARSSGTEPGLGNEMPITKISFLEFD